MDDRVRVVIADDEDDMRVLMRVAFETDARFSVVGEATDGREAIEVCRRVRPDALLLDLRMPNMTGDQALPDLRAACPDMVIVVFSAYATTDAVASCVAAGAASVLSKTTPPAEVADLVVAAAGR